MNTTPNTKRHTHPFPGTKPRDDRFRQPSTYTHPPHETRRGIKAIFPARTTATDGANAPGRVT